MEQGGRKSTSFEERFARGPCRLREKQPDDRGRTTDIRSQRSVAPGEAWGVGIDRLAKPT